MPRFLSTLQARPEKRKKMLHKNMTAIFRLALFGWSCSCSFCHAAVFEFGTTVNSADVDLSSAGNPDEAVLFDYTYTGPMPSEDANTTFEYVIYEPSCSTVFAIFTDDTKAMYFDSFVVDTGTDNIEAYLGIDLASIASSSLWTSTGNTTASLDFCGRMEVYYDGDLVTSVESDVTATVNLLEGGGFETDTLGINMVQSQAVGQIPQVQVDFPLQVFCCNDSAQTQSCPGSTNQGDPIQLCVELASPHTGVRVASVHTLTYSSEVFPGTVVSAVNTGSVANLVTEFDCTQVLGVCRMKFIPAADLFVDDDNPTVNDLLVEGEAVIALGTGTRRELEARSTEVRARYAEMAAFYQPFTVTIQVRSVVESTRIRHEVSTYCTRFLALVGFILIVVTRSRAYYRVSASNSNRYKPNLPYSVDQSYHGDAVERGDHGEAAGLIAVCDELQFE
jgi:hypothetical protein